MPANFTRSPGRAPRPSDGRGVRPVLLSPSSAVALLRRVDSTATEDGGEGGGSFHSTSMTRQFQVAESEILSLEIRNDLRTGKHFSLCLFNIQARFNQTI